MRPTSMRFICSAIAIGAVTLLAGLPARAAIAVKDGQKVAFMGDSITAGGWGNPGGYVRLTVAGLAANGMQVTPVPAGISGHKSDQMLARLQKDVLDKKPDWMTLSCGVNDVWHGARGIPLEQYKTNIAEIVRRCEEAGVKVMILTATVIMEDLGTENNKKLAAYNDYLRSLAKERKCLLTDLNAMFQEVIKASATPGRVLTSDGVHMNGAGDQLMAKGVLQAFGLDETQMKKAQDAWLDIPGGASVRAVFDAGKGKSLRAAHKVTLRQQQKLQAAVANSGQSLEQWANGIYTEEVKKLLKPAGEYESVEAIFEAKKDKEAQGDLQAKFGKRVEEMLK